jgi:formylglycine-generating enzyme required for sulfatase activity
MAFVEGRPLKDVLDTGPRSSVSEALAITGQLLDALQHAHSNNVVHRDIKPANVLLGDDGQLQIADFGIAKIDLVGLTRTGVVMGTPGYMSPEQCLGTPSDHRADIFAAGVILYELLTGEQPFRANAALAVMQQVLTLDPVRPSQLNLDVSPALDVVVAKAMAKRREERFQSAREFAESLRDAAKPRPALAEDIRSMPTITDLVFEGRDRAPPRTPPETPPNKGALTGRSWIAMAAVLAVAVAVVGVIAFLMARTDASLRVDPARSAGQTGVPEPSAGIVAAERKDVSPPIARPVATAPAVPERSPGTVFRDRLADGSRGPEMVVVPAGRFLMGSPNSDKNARSDERPQHEVTISKPYAMGRYEVTFEEYDRFAQATGRALPGDAGWGRGKQPAIHVSFEDARAYAAWLSKETGESYRLPSEAEWEYAARAGTSTSYWWGSDMGNHHANCGDCGSQWDSRHTAPVGSFAANPYGLYDTAGNVWEWVEDCSHETYQGAPGDGLVWLDADGGDCGRRVVRGGSWDDNPRNLRSAGRLRLPTGVAVNYAGFRLARAF